jgi:hypothetical protein
MLGLANKQQQPLHSVAVPLQAANKFYQSLFSNSPLAIPLQQFSFSNTSFRNPPFSNPPSSNFFLAKKLSIKKLPTSKNSCPPSGSLLYLVINKEMEQWFLGRGVTL